MKPKYILAVALLCCLLLRIPAWAASGVMDATGTASVAADGTATIDLTVTLQLDNPREGLQFPLPADAEAVQLNGQRADTSHSDGKLQISLPALSAGRSTFSVRYRLPCVVESSKTGTTLSLPLLSGFALPIEQLRFTVNLPGNITGRPVFYSGYYQENIRPTVITTENSLTVSTNEALKDHETLRLELPVEDALFTVANSSALSAWDWAGAVLMALALGDLGLSLSPKLLRKRRSFTPPEGITAGEVGCCLTGSGTDLSMMVLSWTQLGYIQLEQDKRGRLLLHKRMEMGNERSYHEGRIFQILFGRRETVDTASAHFTRIHRKVGGRSPLQKQLFKPRSGDPRIIRGICCAAAVCSGIQLGSGSVLLMILLGLAMAALSIGIQTGCKSLPLRGKLPLLIAAVCVGVWIMLGVALEDLTRAILMVLLQLIAGILAAYGGKRSELGKQVQLQLLGLRQHMLATGTFEMQLLQQKNPDYFYELVPYALAMGVDRQFARRFDHKQPLPECLWLKNAPRMTAQQCAARLRHIADTMDKAKYRKV